jgi:hypothetical protein
MEKVLEEISDISNSGRVSTMHALCKETIREYNISMPEIQRLVYDFTYYENE